MARLKLSGHAHYRLVSDRFSLTKDQKRFWLPVRIFLGDELKKAREEAGLSQKRLGELSGLHGSTIAQFETGRGRPSPESFRRIFRALKSK